MKLIEVIIAVFTLAACFGISWIWCKAEDFVHRVILRLAELRALDEERARRFAVEHLAEQVRQVELDDAEETDLFQSLMIQRGCRMYEALRGLKPPEDPRMN